MFRPCLLIRCQNWYLEIVRHQRCCLIRRTFSANKSKCKSVDLNIGLKSEEKLRAHKESSKGLDPPLKRKLHCFVIFFVSDPCITEDWFMYSTLAQKIKEVVFLYITIKVMFPDTFHSSCRMYLGSLFGKECSFAPWLNITGIFVQSDNNFGHVSVF